MAGNIVFSQVRKGFVSRGGTSFKAELYADIVEFQSLCHLLGPYGVKAIDREVLKNVLSNINSLKVLVLEAFGNLV